MNVIPAPYAYFYTLAQKNDDEPRLGPFARVAYLSILASYRQPLGMQPRY